MNDFLEPQYNELIEIENKFGRSQLGLMTNQSWNVDPKRLLFTLSRYKFVSRMLSGLQHVLEVGCADAFGSRIVQQQVENLTVTDFDPIFIDDVNKRASKDWPMNVQIHDFAKSSTEFKYDGAFALDVLEHISADNEYDFIVNMKNSLKETGVLILGMPSSESQLYASPASLLGHVNCKTAEEFKLTLRKHFYNVFMFSMNDEVVHTGYERMSHYLIAICAHKTPQR